MPKFKIKCICFVDAEDEDEAEMKFLHNIYDLIYSENIQCIDEVME